MSPHDAFDGILTSLHDAMLDDAHWVTTSRLIDESCGIRGSALVVGKGRSHTDGQIFLARFCHRGERRPDRERWYFDNYYPWDERIPRVAGLPDSQHVARLQRGAGPGRLPTRPERTPGRAEWLQHRLDAGGFHRWE